MDLFTADFWSALVSIIIIDLMLAGDNAIVIALAARNLPKDKQNKVILWGTIGAIIIRSTATLAVVWLLKIPGLLLVGGILLLWIAYKLLVEDKSHKKVKSATSTVEAIRTIIIADAVMGLDNVLAVAGAAHGSFVLVILGLIVSVPIVIWGSKLFIGWVNRYPIILYIGAGVLAFTAGKMIVEEPFVSDFLGGNTFIKWALIALLVVSIIGLGVLKKRDNQRSSKRTIV